MDFKARRRMLMNMESQWADEPLVIFENSGMSFGQVTMNGAYTDANLTQNTIYVTAGCYSMVSKKSLYLEDVTKYKTFTVVGKWDKATAGSDPGYAYMGILKEDYYNGTGNYNDLSDFSAGKEIAVKTTTEKTYTFDISKLKGKQRFYLKCDFVFSDGDTSSFRITKMMLE